VKRVCAGALYACKGAHTLFASQRERERERKRERERVRKRERERVRKRESVILIFKRNDGCLGTF
jgi:hypothetical protein